MKTILKYALMAFAAVLGVACNRIKESAETVSFPEKEIVLTATREGLATRSFRLDDGSVWWSPNEEVSVFYGAGSNGGSKFVSMNSAIAETVELQGSVQMAGSGKDFWAVYPYSEGNSCDGSSIITVIPDQQIGVEGNFANDVFPAVAKSSSLSLAFWNICGGVKFFVSRNDIKSVTFKGNNNEPLAGKVKVAFGSDGTPVIQEVIDAKSEVTLVAPDGGTLKVGKYYYITLLPTELRGGITMVFETDNTVGTLVSDKVQTVKRSVFGVLKSVDAKVDEWKDVQEASKGWDVFIWHDAKFKFDDLTDYATYTGYEGTVSAPRLGITQANKELNVTWDEFNQWVLNDVDVNMSGEGFGDKYDISWPRLILAKGGVEPGDELPAYEDAVLVDLVDINMYYSKSLTGLTLNVQSPYNWQRPFEGAELMIDNTFEELNKKDVHYVYVLYPAHDNTKNIHIVIKFSFKIEGSDPIPGYDEAPYTWLELPETHSGDGLTFFAHNMDGGKYVNAARSGVRNWSFYWDASEHLSMWVAYPLNNNLKGSGSRTNAWGFDPLLPSSAQPDLTMGSYGGGWTRGHQIPSADRLNYRANVSTFYGTNMTPQQYDFNGEIWASLEGKVRSYAALADTLYVVTGCLYKDSSIYTGIRSGFAVKVPTHYFKALLFKGISTYTISDGYMAAGFFMPHDQSISNDNCTNYIMSIDELEKQTGIDFFPNLAGKIGASGADKVESTAPSSWWK